MSRPVDDRESPALLVIGGLAFAAAALVGLWGFQILEWALEGRL